MLAFVLVLINPEGFQNTIEFEADSFRKTFPESCWSSSIDHILQVTFVFGQIIFAMSMLLYSLASNKSRRWSCVHCTQYAKLLRKFFCLFNRLFLLVPTRHLAIINFLPNFIDVRRSDPKLYIHIILIYCWLAIMLWFRGLRRTETQNYSTVETLSSLMIRTQIIQAINSGCGTLRCKIKWY